jgi:hypothetical protein
MTKTISLALENAAKKVAFYHWVEGSIAELDETTTGFWTDGILLYNRVRGGYPLFW